MQYGTSPTEIILAIAVVIGAIAGVNQRDRPAFASSRASMRPTPADKASLP